MYEVWPGLVALRNPKRTVSPDCFLLRMSLGVGDCIEIKKKPWEHWGKELPSASCDSLASLGPYTLSFCPRGGIIQSEEETQRE